MPINDSKPKHKSVRFMEDTAIGFEIEDYGNNEDVWMTSSDLHRIAECAKELANKWRNEGYAILLENTFEDPAKNAQKLVAAFVEHDCGGHDNYDTLRGIERFVSPQHDIERCSMRKRSIKSILSRQSIMKKRGIAPSEIRAELADISNNFSRCAKLFARRLGKADEAGVSSGEQKYSDIAKKYVQESNSGTIERRKNTRLAPSCGAGRRQ